MKLFHRSEAQSAPPPGVSAPVRAPRAPSVCEPNPRMHAGPTGAPALRCDGVGMRLHLPVALRSGPRGPLAFGLAVAAAVLGGTGAVLLGLVALMLLFDAVVPVPGVTRPEAEARFRAVVRGRRRTERVRRLRRLAPERLDVLDDRTGWASTAGRRALGVQMIPIDSVTGTLEPFKARTFDRAFRPDRTAAEHWKRLWLAQAHGASLPPISVYRVDGRHVVRDGHHRLSVARDHGLASIEAEVVELGRRRAA
jgi:hypothetical protein